MEMLEEDRPQDDILTDDVEIEKWWKQRNSPTIGKMRTSAKNSAPAGASFNFSGF